VGAGEGSKVGSGVENVGSTVRLPVSTVALSMIDTESVKLEESISVSTKVV